MPLLYLPDPGSWASKTVEENPITPRDTLNASASTASEQQLTLAAENAPLRILYGQARVGPQLAYALSYNGAMIYLVVWGHGEVESIVDLQMDDKVLPAGVTYKHYLGTKGLSDNLLWNPAFASTNGVIPDYWSIYNNDGGAVPTTTSMIAGPDNLPAVRVQWTGARTTTKGIYHNQRPLTKRGVTYVIAFQVRAGAQTAGATVIGEYSNAPGWSTYTVISSPVLNNTWQWYIAVGQRAGGDSNELFISIETGGMASGVSNFDIAQPLVYEGSTFHGFNDGVTNPTIPASLVAAFAAQSPSVAYTDTLPGICYSVVTVPAGASSGFPRLTATIKGRKVYDPRSNFVLNSNAMAGWTQYVEGTGAVSVTTVTDPVYGSVTRITKTAGANGDRVGLTRSDTRGLTGGRYIGGVTIKTNVAGTAGYAFYADMAKVGGGLVTTAPAVSSTVGVWQRISGTASGPLAGGGTFYAPLISGPVGSSVDILNPQLELDSVTSGYIAAGTVPVNTGRFDPPNLFTSAYDFADAAAWPLNGGFTVSANSQVGPMGATDADRITSNGVPTVTTRAITSTSAAQTFTVIAKDGTHSPSLLIRNNTTATSLVPATMTVGFGSNSYGTWEVTDLGGGWRKVRMTALSGFTVGDQLQGYFGATGAVANGLYWDMWYGAWQDAMPSRVLSPATSTPTEKIINGGFDRDNYYWEKAAGWTISGGVAVATAAASGAPLLQKDVTEIGKTYRVTVTCTSLTAGSANVLLYGGASAFATITAPGTYTGVVQAQHSGEIYIWPLSTLTATFDNLSIVEIEPYAWSDNPALCAAEFATNTTYGMSKTVDWYSVGNVAADNDVLAGGTEKLRTLNLAMDTVQTTQAWLDTLRTYASCWCVPSANGLKFVSDKVGSTVATYDHASGQISNLASLKKRGVQNTPTVMTVTYRDVSINPNRDATATVYAAGVLAGTTPRRESQVSLPGITRYSQAFREATERLNKLTLNDLSFSLGVFDEALSVEVGDIVAVTHPLGLTAKQMRVMGVQGDYGRYQLSLVEYDPVVYSAAVATGPTFADTTLPNPAAPPAIGAVTMAEEVFQLENGTYSSRWRVTWPASTFAYLDRYRAELYVGSTLIHSNSLDTNVWATPSVQENTTYTVKIAVVSSIGSTGAWSTQSGTALGKFLIPSDVPSIAAFEAGGTVYASWTASSDVDIWRYEVRYGPVGGTWATALVVDRVDALRLQSDQIPVGTWKIYVKAIDSVQQYSTNAASATVTVTSDASAFLVNTLYQTAPTLTGMQEYSMARDDTNRYWITEDNVAFGTKFSSNLSTYTNALATYHASATSEWLGESEDFGLLLGGQWTGSATVNDISGSHISYLGNSVDGSTWVYPAGLSQKLNARFARMDHQALTTSTMQVIAPNNSIRIDAIPRSENGNSTSLTTNGKTVFLANQYVSVKSLGIAPIGTVFASHSLDNVGAPAMNPADKAASLIITGNVLTTSTATQYNSVRCKHPLPATGKWYWEYKLTAGASNLVCGLTTRSVALANYYPGSSGGSVGYYGGDGSKYLSGTGSTYGASYGVNDVIGVLWDATTFTLTFYKNNTPQGAIATGLSGELFPAFNIQNTSDVLQVNIAPSQLIFAPPTGALPLPFAFDVHIFDSSAARIARDFYWSFDGV